MHCKLYKLTPFADCIDDTTPLSWGIFSAPLGAKGDSSATRAPIHHFLPHPHQLPGHMTNFCDSNAGFFLWFFELVFVQSFLRFFQEFFWFYNFVIVFWFCYSYRTICPVLAKFATYFVTLDILQLFGQNHLILSVFG